MEYIYKIILNIANYVLNIKAKYFEKETAAFDEKVKDSRDFVGAVDNSKKPTKFILNDGRIFNQNKKGYEYSCTGQSVACASNEELFIKADKVTHNSGELLFDEAVKRGIADRNRGAAIIDLVKLGKEIGYIDVYYQVNTLEDIKTALYNANPIVTGSNKIDRKDSIDGLVKKISNSYGHAFTIVGWNDNKVIGEYKGALVCENSYGTQVQDKGRFWIPYDLVNDILFNTRKAVIIYPEWTKIPKEDRWKEYIESRRSAETK